MSNTSWGEVADWYNRLLADPESYQSQVVLPGLFRMIEADGKLDISDKFIDIACGQGFFSKSYMAAGAGEVTGSDISPELITLARKNAEGERNISFHIAPAHKQEFAKTGYFSRASIAQAGFAVTNMEEWISHKKSEKGPRSKAEDKARREFPLFLAIAARKL